MNSNNSERILAEQDGEENHLSQGPHDFVSGNKEQSAPVMYSRKVSFTEKSGHVEEEPKSAAAAVAAKLTASSSSAQMLTYVLSSLASEGVIGNPIKESSGDYPSEKRQKLENDRCLYTPQHPQAQVPPFSQPESFQQNIPVLSQGVPSNEQPPPPSSPPPLPPLPPMQPYPVPQYVPSAGAIASGPYGYGAIQQQPVSLPSCPPGPQANGVSPFTASPGSGYQSFPADAGFYSQTSSLPMAPITRQ